MKPTGDRGTESNPGSDDEIDELINDRDENSYEEVMESGMLVSTMAGKNCQLPTIWILASKAPADNLSMKATIYPNRNTQHNGDSGVER